MFTSIVSQNPVEEILAGRVMSYYYIKFKECHGGRDKLLSLSIMLVNACDLPPWDLAGAHAFALLDLVSSLPCYCVRKKCALLLEMVFRLITNTWCTYKNEKHEHSKIKLRLTKSRKYNMYTSDFTHNSTNGNMKLRIMLGKPVTIEQINPIPPV